MKYNKIPDFSNRVILTDCDGVILDWLYHFTRKYASYDGYDVVDSSQYNMGKRYGRSSEWGKNRVKEFNNSPSIRYLPPFRDSVWGMRTLFEKYGYVFHVITALAVSSEAINVPRQNRQDNLRNIFGNDGIIDKLTCTDPNEDKLKWLKEYKGTGCFWIEDSPKNAIVGAKLGLQTYLMDQEHNRDFDAAAHGITRIRSWSDFMKKADLYM